MSAHRKQTALLAARILTFNVAQAVGQIRGGLFNSLPVGRANLYLTARLCSVINSKRAVYLIMKLLSLSLAE